MYFLAFILSNMVAHSVCATTDVILVCGADVPEVDCVLPVGEFNGITSVKPDNVDHTIPDNNKDAGIVYIISKKTERLEIVTQLTSVKKIIVMGTAGTTVSLSATLTTRVTEGEKTSIKVNSCIFKYVNSNGYISFQEIILTNNGKIPKDGGNIHLKSEITVPIKDIEPYYDFVFEQDSKIFIKCELSSGSSNTISILESSISVNDDTVIVGDNGIPKGMVVFKIKINDISQLLTINTNRYSDVAPFKGIFLFGTSENGQRVLAENYIQKVEFTKNWDDIDGKSLVLDFSFEGCKFDLIRPPIKCSAKYSSGDYTLYFPFNAIINNALKKIIFCLGTGCIPTAEDNSECFVEVGTDEQFKWLLIGLTETITTVDFTIKESLKFDLNLSTMTLSKDLNIVLTGPGVSSTVTISDPPKVYYNWELKSVNLKILKLLTYKKMHLNSDSVIDPTSSNNACVDKIICSLSDFSQCYQKHALEAEITGIAIDLSDGDQSIKFSETQITFPKNNKVTLGKTIVENTIYAEKIILIGTFTGSETYKLTILGEGNGKLVPATFNMGNIIGDSISIVFDKTTLDKVPSSSFILIAKDATEAKKIKVYSPLPTSLSFSIIDEINYIYDQHPITAKIVKICVASISSTTDCSSSAEVNTLYKTAKNAVEITGVMNNIEEGVKMIRMELFDEIEGIFVFPKIGIKTFSITGLADNAIKISANLTIPTTINTIKFEKCMLTIKGDIPLKINSIWIDTGTYYSLSGNIIINNVCISDELVDKTFLKGVLIERLSIMKEISGDSKISFDEESYSWSDVVASTTDSKDEFEMNSKSSLVPAGATEPIKITPNSNTSYHALATFYCLFSLRYKQKAKLIFSLANTNATSILPITILVGIYPFQPDEEEIDVNEVNEAKVQSIYSKSLKKQFKIKEIPSYFQIIPEFDSTWKNSKLSTKVVFRFVGDKVNLDISELNKTLPKNVKILLQTDGSPPITDDELFENDPPSSTPKSKGLSTGAIVGIVIASIAVVAAIITGVVFSLKKRKASDGDDNP